SLLYAPDLRSLSLAPAYDIVSTAVYDQSTREMAFAIGGDRFLDAITRASFVRAAEEIGLAEKAAMRAMDEVCGRFETALAEAAEELDRQGFTGAEGLREKMLRGGAYRNM
ncbi:MAG: HipA domain-containing protein, partial [Lachnospiraceae bacterium]|nr:HipA domain-containing protein [Lachnospiraceae bacterium]